MLRRNIVTGALAAAGAFLAAAANAARGAPATPDRPQDRPQEHPKVVYHLCDLDKVSFVIGNIRNHFDGMGGPDNVTIALVVHGPALKAFHATGASADLVHSVDQFTKAGLELNACLNTMKAQNVALKDLLHGFISADRGGVVRLAELQSQGYAYLRP